MGLQEMIAVLHDPHRAVSSVLHIEADRTKSVNQASVSELDASIRSVSCYLNLLDTRSGRDFHVDK